MEDPKIDKHKLLKRTGSANNGKQKDNINDSKMRSIQLSVFAVSTTQLESDSRFVLTKRNDSLVFGEHSFSAGLSKKKRISRDGVKLNINSTVATETQDTLEVPVDDSRGDSRLKSN